MVVAVESFDAENAAKLLEAGVKQGQSEQQTSGK
jgi:hypothetical protein